jgi:hypothetical protein
MAYRYFAAKPASWHASETLKREGRRLVVRYDEATEETDWVDGDTGKEYYTSWRPSLSTLFDRTEIFPQWASDELRVAEGL